MTKFKAPKANKDGFHFYTVQFTLPVNNPANNVVMRRVKDGYAFEVPLNTPDIHKLDLSQLLAMSVLKGDNHIIHSP